MGCCYKTAFLWAFVFAGASLGGYLVSHNGVTAKPAEGSCACFEGLEPIIHFYEYLLWLSFAVHCCVAFLANYANDKVISGVRDFVFVIVLFPLAVAYLLLAYSQNIEFDSVDPSSVELIGQGALCLANYRHHVLAFYVIYSGLTTSFTNTFEDDVPRIALVTSLIAIAQHFHASFENTVVATCALSYLIWALLSWYFAMNVLQCDKCCFASCNSSSSKKGEDKPAQKKASPKAAAPAGDGIFSDAEDDDDESSSQKGAAPAQESSKDGGTSASSDEPTSKQQVHIPSTTTSEGEGKGKVEASTPVKKAANASEDGVVPDNAFEQRSPIDADKIPRSLRTESAGPKSPVGITSSRLRPRRSTGRSTQ